MPSILSVSEVIPPFQVNQDQATAFARELFSRSFKDIERLLKAFQNGQIMKRHFVKSLEWFKENHTFEDKNNAYIESAVTLGREAIVRCLQNEQFLKKAIPFQEIDAIFFISTTGLSTPSIDARIINELPFNPHIKRVPIWGLGCAGGASGLSRAFEYCSAYPSAKVLVLSIELCSLTFQKDDYSKSNLIGTSLFADGIACALIIGDKAGKETVSKKETIPTIVSTQSTIMPDSLDVMGWDIRNSGLFVIFSRDIPHIIEGWLKPNVISFLSEQQVEIGQIKHFIAHPGGKKVLDAYVKSLEIPPSMNDISHEVLTNYGNMSSATILYVLKRFMELDIPQNDWGLATALGPGFSSEILLLRWQK
ncbi:type III polyketide synthase [Neobacillus cucumis]|uniref:type III polyketide synthase n=1 Tax=Neobacillus cucumis TaxID=1740721 RepID=UPI00196398DF|nr:3-oxoacyl-[acyl-carrier-protein] synthase III C-terminal domain-containing protein [Neobacillus cucumis]MBM7654863.1 alkylresorcinol/alkylpyrone synthase [Neobacillus cucumis]